MLGIKHLVNIECQQNIKCVSFVGGDSTRNKETSILNVLLRQYKSPTGPSKF